MKKEEEEEKNLKLKGLAYVDLLRQHGYKILPNAECWEANSTTSKRHPQWIENPTLLGVAIRDEHLRPRLAPRNPPLLN